MIQTARSRPLAVAAREAGGNYSHSPASAARQTFFALLDAAAREVLAKHPLSPDGANLRPCETVTASVRVAQRKNAGAV